MVEIIEISEASNEILSQVNGLLPQLSKSASPLSLESLDILASPEHESLCRQRGKEGLGNAQPCAFSHPNRNQGLG